MRGLMLFGAGILCGLAVPTIVAQNEVVALNHVALSVPDIPAAAAFYTEKMGFREAFRNSNAQGQPTAIYLQISKNTFLELQQANAQRPAGVNHFGLEVGNIKSAVAMFKQRGAAATDPTGPSAFSGAMLANVTDPHGVRIELAELGPASLQRKAMDNWGTSAAPPRTAERP